MQPYPDKHGAGFDEEEEDAAGTLVRAENLDEAPTMLAEPSDLPAAPIPIVVHAHAEGRTTVLPRPAPASEAAGDAGAPLRWVLERQPRYESRRLLGVGGLGEVSLALDNDIGRHVAVKRMRPDVAGHEALLRFVEEVRTVGRLEHPNIVPIHDVGVDAERQYYFVMKYVEGETLEKVIERLAARDPEYERRYSLTRRADICVEIMNAIGYAHAQRIIHRDIKPANIMIGKYGEVMVMDWGIAKDFNADARAPAAQDADAAPPTARGRIFKTQASALVGTPAYMSPEQARGENDAVDARSDIYSLAVLFHELLTLRHYLDDCRSVEAVLAAIVSREFSTPDLLIGPGASEVPAEYGHFLRKAMRKRPEERYSSVAEMAEVFQRVRGGDYPIQCACTLVRSPTHRFLRVVNAHPLLVLSSLLTLAAIALFSIAYTLVHLATG